ncbi:MAG: PxKF domain-containing protein [Actinomycetota bacterium]|nr:PxKF domain-containing protein [Actinomycetota bacterium]
MLASLLPFVTLVALVAGMLPASAASVTGAVLDGGVAVNGVRYAKSGSALLLSVTTDDVTKCVELTGAHEDQKSGTASTTWSFPLTANSGSGVQTVTATAYKNVNPKGKCVAEAGEKLGTFSVSYTLDNTGPLVTAALVPAANSAGWNSSDVTIKWSATDPVGVPTPPSDQTVTANTTTAGVTRTTTATDALGNSATGSVTVKLDKDLPTITPDRSPAANGAGWNNTDVTVSFTTADGLSGVAGSNAPTKTFGEGANQTHTGTVTDVAGNTASATVSGINVDKTAPTLSGAPTTSANGAGWYKGDVTVAWTAGDALSGIAATPANSTIIGEGQGLKATETVPDKAGNTTTADSALVKIDRTAPVTGISGTSNDWRNGDVTVTLSPGDTLSGVASTTYTVDGGAPQTGTSFTLATEGDHTVTYQSTDKAGNTEAVKTATVRIDKTAPTIGHKFTPSSYTDGAWANQDVTVTFICADQGGSGVASCSPAVTKSAEGAGQQVTGTASDGAGNSASDTATVSIDKTAPTISAAPDRAANANGWYDDDVIVGFRCADALSGIATCPARKTLAEGASQSASGTAYDAAGNSASAGVSGINVDKTAPTLSGTPSTTGWSRGDVTVNWTASDALSGLDGPGPGPSTVTGEGDALSASAEVRDKAGNKTPSTVTGIKIDRTAPSTSVSVPAPLATGWYASGVVVTLTGVDPLSDVAKTYYSVDGSAAQEYAGPFTHSLKGEHTIKFWSVDVAGNTEDRTAPENSITLKVDGTPPVTTISLPAAFSTGWYADMVTVAFAASDAESGVAKTYYSVDGGAAQTYDGTFEHPLDGVHIITFWSVDVAGNTEDKAKPANSVEIKVDTSEPTITGSRTPVANSHGWNNTDVTVSFECKDSQSGVAIENCTPATPVTNEGANQSVTGTAKDNVGKIASTTVGGINIDKTKPTLTGAATAAPNAAGWYKGDVSVQWTGQDALSGTDPATQPANSTVAGEGSNLGAGPVSISDKAGNAGSGSISGIKIDRTAPGIAGKVVNEDGTPRTPLNGWYNSAARVRFSCSDALSGVQECAGDVVLSDDGANQNASGSATDMADNQNSATVTGINIDSKAPQTSANNECEGANGWCRQTATVTLTAADQDGLSGVKEIHYIVNGGQEKTAEGSTTKVLVPLPAKSGMATVQFWSVDNAGNVEGKGGVSLKFDNIGPTVTHTVSPEANAAGWNNVDTTVHFDAIDDDGGSGVDMGTVTPDQTVGTETTGQVVNGSAKDVAGNTGTDSVTVKLDKTAPGITGAATTSPNANGWYSGSVAVRFTCTDGLSGIATCPVDAVLTSDGSGQSATGKAVDRADNEKSVSVGGINIDSTKPAIAIEGLKPIYTLGEATNLSCSATDGGSGVDANGCKVTVTGGTAGGVGTFTYTATATDKAGNIATQTGTYKVTYQWNGFLQPINDTAHQIGTATSIFKAGSTVPAKFQLKKADGTIVQTSTAPEWLTPAKGSSTSAAVDETQSSDPATSGSTYRWDATSQQYIYNWGTAKNQANYYWRIGVKLDDGQVYTVNIGLR